MVFMELHTGHFSRKTVLDEIVNQLEDAGYLPYRLIVDEREIQNFNQNPKEFSNYICENYRENNPNILFRKS